jgi:tetratricopeptide (TPR) repeat protein
MAKILLTSLAFLFLVHDQGFSQNLQFEQGLALEKQFKVDEALEKYREVLKTQPNHAGALTHASRMLSNIGGRLPLTVKSEKKKYYLEAMALAERALKLDKNSIDAHLAYVVSLGLLSEVSESAQEKVKHAKVIYDEATTMIALDSTFAAAYFVLGKWHLELSRLNWFERLACELFFGGLPDGISIDKALLYLKRASALEPNTILYLFGEANAYHVKGDSKKASSLLKHALTLPIKEPDDVQRKKRCTDLLNEIEGK